MSWTTIDKRLARVEAVALATLAAPPRRKTPAELAEAVGIAADPWQISVLSADWQQSLWNCSRQSGKSTAENGNSAERRTQRKTSMWTWSRCSRIAMSPDDEGGS